jgi:hypothetical protein
LVSQRPIAVHAAEHPGKSDIGVYMCRKLLRDGVRGQLPDDVTRARARANGDTLPMYAQDSVLTLPKAADDRALLQRVGKQVLGILREADDLPAHERDAQVRRRLSDIDRQHEGFEQQSVEIETTSDY